MKLILNADVERLGRIGEMVEVADGYARNYLLPCRLAMLATPDNQRRIEAEKKRAAVREAVRLENLRELAAALDGKSVTISVKATEEHKLYGSVGPEEIAEAVRAEHNLVLDPAHVTLEAPFKELGVFDVKLELTPAARQARGLSLSKAEPNGELVERSAPKAEAYALLKVWVVGE